MKHIKRNYELPEKVLAALNKIKDENGISLQKQVSAAVFAWQAMTDAQRYSALRKCIAWLSSDESSQPAESTPRRD
ncbi:MAG: hypothetical protein PHU85_00465 [Phycisphaerae bacterium]|nr:hypothetical protein [Phycisphaerae bacterium]